eukprot:scaffold129894_cov53-Attheya_sp.AAC.1
MYVLVDVTEGTSANLINNRAVLGTRQLIRADNERNPFLSTGRNTSIPHQQEVGYIPRGYVCILPADCAVLSLG